MTLVEEGDTMTDRRQTHDVYRCGKCRGLQVVPKGWGAPTKCGKCKG